MRDLQWSIRRLLWRIKLTRRVLSLGAAKTEPQASTGLSADEDDGTFVRVAKPITDSHHGGSELTRWV